MTRKDFELIAKSVWRSGYVKNPNKVKQEARESMRHLIATDLATELATTNENFDRQRFMVACGVENG